VPVGVIAVETQVVNKHSPADPGMPDSSEQNIPQAGQVWYPDSAAKTAMAMEEFDLEGLPLMVLANWRGFSGGQRDLFDGVLQAGSLIVEHLRTYKRPVFVYIPCGAELRGGAWVVVDSQINATHVEMYADPTARGGVLEPEGVVEIKFRTPDLLRMMHRVDPVIQQLKTVVAGGAKAAAAAAAVAAGTSRASVGGGAGPSSGGHAAGDEAEAAAAAIKAREKALLPVYQQVARQFADMHDTPTRMLAKGVLSGIVPWAHARRFFALRLRRRLMEETVANHVTTSDASVPRHAALAMVRSWHAQAGNSPSVWPLSPQDPHTRRLVAEGLPGGGAESVNSVTSLYLSQLSEDQEFLDWTESVAGRTRIAAELKVLRARSASRMVDQVLGTTEGKEGLLKALQSALRRDSMLGMQLKMMISEAMS